LNELAFLTLDSLLPKGFSKASMGRVLFGLDKSRKINQGDFENYKKFFSATLTRLKSKGYVSKAGNTKRVIWKITENGKNFLESLKNNLPEDDGVLRLFIFDIPEDLKPHRDWIRAELVASGYRLLQKSVWLGERPLLQNFLQTLADKNLFRFIHFFEVKELGTLVNLEEVD